MGGDAAEARGWRAKFAHGGAISADEEFAAGADLDGPIACSPAARSGPHLVDAPQFFNRQHRRRGPPNKALKPSLGRAPDRFRPPSSPCRASDP